MSYGRGAQFEYEARDKIFAYIYNLFRPPDIYVTRSAGSHSEADLVFVFRHPAHPDVPTVWLVQCSKHRKSSSEIEKLVTKCKNVGATPVFAYLKDERKNKTFILDILDYDGSVMVHAELEH